MKSFVPKLTLRGRVLEIIEAQDGLVTCSDIASQIGLSKRRAGSLLCRLAQYGAITRVRERDWVEAAYTKREQEAR